MDIKLALAIYNRPWLIEPNAALACISLLQAMKEGEVFKYGDLPERMQYFPLHSTSRVAPKNIWEAKDHPGYDGATTVVLPVSGPLMKENYCGGFGTAALMEEFHKAENTSSVKSIVLLIDSPGGTVNGTELFANTIRASTKATLALIDGMAASAAYWLASAAQEIYVTEKTAVVGSIGTMISWWDHSEALKANGTVHREFYATASYDKNRSFREANQGDGRVLVEELLDPTNDIFIQSVKRHRYGKLSSSENVFSGKTYIAKDAQHHGLIDGVATFQQAITRSITLSKINTSTMTTTTYPVLCSILGWENGFEITADGIYLQEADFAKITNCITALQASVTKLEADNAAINTNITALQETNSIARQRIADLEAENTSLKNQDAGTFSVPLAKGEDEFQRADPKIFETSYDRALQAIRTQQ